MSGCVGGESNSDTKARVVVQQCISASLRHPGDKEEEASQIGKGIVVYVCFLQGASESIIPKMVQTVLNVKLSESADGGDLVSVKDVQGSILIVPQASLGGKVKGRKIQYHRNCEKTLASQLFTDFVLLCKSNSQLHVRHGIYGDRQILKMDTNGPFTHLLEF